MEVINVIEISDGIVLQAVSFPIVDSESPESKVEVVTAAEEFFKKLVKEYYPTIREDALESYAEDGCCFGHNYSIQLVWSNGIKASQESSEDKS